MKILNKFITPILNPFVQRIQKKSRYSCLTKKANHSANSIHPSHNFERKNSKTLLTSIGLLGVISIGLLTQFSARHSTTKSLLNLQFSPTSPPKNATSIPFVSPLNESCPLLPEHLTTCPKPALMELPQVWHPLVNNFHDLDWQSQMKATHAEQGNFCPIRKGDKEDHAASSFDINRNSNTATLQESQTIAMEPNLKINRLDDVNFEKAKKYIDEKKVARSRANGQTGVYFPPNETFIFKNSGANRFSLEEKMEKAQQLRAKNSYNHLVVANTAVYGDYIIQSKLPINTNLNTGILQIGNYIENLDAYTDAIKEFTAFLCQSSLKDINSKTARGIYLRHLARTTIARHDNIGLILEKQNTKAKGKIALVDLDGFDLKVSGIGGVEDAIRFFPYHADEIIEVARKFFPDIDKERSWLEEIRDGNLLYYNKIYTNHANFLKSKGISPINFNKIPEVSEERKIEREEIIGEEILKTLQDDWIKMRFVNFKVDENSDELRLALRRISTEMIKSVELFISEHLNFKLGNITSVTQEELIWKRQFIFSIESSNSYLFKIYKDITQSLKKIDFIEMKDSGHRGPEVITGQIIKVILKEMARGGDIAFVDIPEQSNYESVIFV